MNIIAGLVFVTSLNPRFGIDICFASGWNKNSNPTPSLADAGLMLITKPGPGSAFPSLVSYMYYELFNSSSEKDRRHCSSTLGDIKGSIFPRWLITCIYSSTSDFIF
jgi:hypothetical protein